MAKVQVATDRRIQTLDSADSILAVRGIKLPVAIMIYWLVHSKWSPDNSKFQGGARGSGSQESNGFNNLFGGGNDDEDDGDANQTNGIGGIFGF